MDQDKIKGLEAAIAREYGNITGIVVQKNGVRLYENYFHGYTADNPVHVYSVTKSVFSALLGIAIDRGYLQSIDQKVLDFFPHYAVPAGESAIQGVAVKHLLTMTAPYKYRTEPYEEFFSSDNWIAFALNLLGGAGRAGKFLYSPIIGTHILSGILEKATGEPVLAFAQKNLFSPLAINVPHSVALGSKEEHIAVMGDKNTSGWVVDPQGINTASWGLFLTPVDMAKIGQLYLNGGMWQGKQVVPRGWVAASTREQVVCGQMAYGYLWWVIDDKERVYAALGDGGNAIYVNAGKQLVVAIASRTAPVARDPIALIAGHIEPIFTQEV